MSDHEDDSSVEKQENPVVESSAPNSEGNKGDNVKLEEKVVASLAMNTTTSEDSEYETLEEDNGSSQTSGSRRSSFSDHLSDGIGIEDEREDGDGEEENSSAKDKKLDDDEDRRNPQYIPKKGTFYEHDDRTMTDENEEENNGNEVSKRETTEEGEKDTSKKGKVWVEKPERDRWSHDLYNEDEQKPKSTQELIDTYGYDIRNEEAPPKARRRRRYGRGPNKYTRNWEDEDAYTRAVPTQRRVFRNNKEDFPDLGENNTQFRNNRDQGRGKSKSPLRPEKSSHQHHPQIVERERGTRREQEKEVLERPMDRDREKPKPVQIKESPVLPAFEKPVERQPFPQNKLNSFPSSPGTLMNNQPDRRDKEVEPPKVGRGRGFRGTGKARPTMEFTASRGRAVLPAAFNGREASNGTTTSNTPVPETLKHAADILVQDFSHIYIGSNNNNTNNIVEETIIPRSERRSHNHNSSGVTDAQQSSEGNVSTRSKRYSTQRQRSLPETTPPPTYSPPHSIPYYTQPPPNSYVPAPVYNEVAPPPVTSPPMQIPLGVAFLPPGPPPSATAAPPYPPPPLLNYMPPPSYQPIALQPPMTGQFEDLSQAAELYQGQGGITYYSPQTQMHRPNPPRRVKLAIPIVPPPDSSQQANSNSKQRSSKQEVQSVVT